MTRSRAVYGNQHVADEIPTSVISDEPEFRIRPEGIEGHNARDGRFLPGNRFGRKPIDLDRTLRAMVDGEQCARLLVSVAERPGPDQLKAICYIYDRLAGRPRQSLTVSADDSAGVIAMRQLYAAISGTTYEPPAQVEGEYAVLPVEPAPADPLT